MDVTCDRCGTEYEFEEALVSTRGTTVKCTQCGHLFKVYKPDAPAEAEAVANPWTLRRADGSIHRLSSLADLTSLIEEGAFGREDELSRTSKAWKRLGDIEELEVFFARAHASAAPRKRRTTGAPQLGVRKASPPARSSDPPSRGDNTVVGRFSPPAAGATASAGAAPAPPPTAAETAAAPISGPTAAAGESQAVAPPSEPTPPVKPAVANGASAPRTLRRPRRTGIATPIAPPPGPAEVDTAESEPTTVHEPRRIPREPLPPLPDTYEPFARRKAPLWLWLFVTAATLGAFATWLLWPMFERRSEPVEARKPDPAIEFLSRADAAFASHREQRFEEALNDYVKALAYHENDPHVLSSISRVYGVWAQELLDRAEALSKDDSNTQDVERRSQILARTKQAREYAEQAKRYAENAARKNPGNEEAEVALSDALRLTGNLVAARSELDRARSPDSTPNGETLRVAALLAIAEAHGDLRAGLKLVSQAVAQDPDLIRARLLLVRCLIADGDLVGARYHLGPVISRDRSHPAVLAIEQELARAAAPAEVATKTDAAPADSTALVAANGDKDRDKDKGSERGYDNLSHEGYIARGQKMLESGQVTNAKRMFEQALFIRPSSAEAHAGLGFVALEKGRPKLAVEHFQQAKRGGNGEALIGLGDAYRRLNRAKDALRAYQSYANEHPRGPQISIARAQIERLTEEASASKK